MPQMDTTTFLPQVFWLVLIFTIFYLIVLKNILPTISRILKVRTKKLSQGHNLLNEMEDEKQALVKSYSTIVGTNLQTSSQTLHKIFAGTNSWINKSLDLKTGKSENSLSNIIQMNASYFTSLSQAIGKQKIFLSAVSDKK